MGRNPQSVEDPERSRGAIRNRACALQSGVIGVGIIGAGRIAVAHGRALDKIEGVRLVGAADVNEEALERFARQFGCQGFADYRDLLGHSEVNYVVLCLPHHLHRPAAVEAAAAGKHLFIEKPLALDVVECDEILAAARQAGVALHVGHHHHFVPVNVKARDLIDSREFGDLIMAVDTWYKPFFLKNQPRPAWFLDRACGGGMWHMNGPHMIDRLMFFSGRPVVAVKASVGSRFYDYSAHDFGMAHLEFADGLHAQIAHCGFRAGVERFELDFTLRQAQIKLLGSRLLVGREDEWTPVEVPTWDTHVKQHEQFLKCLRTGGEAPVTGEWGREVVRVLLACEQSAQTGREVRLDEGGTGS